MSVEHFWHISRSREGEKCQDMLLARRCPSTASVTRRPAALSRLARSQCSSNSKERRNPARLRPEAGADHKPSLLKVSQGARVPLSVAGCHISGQFSAALNCVSVVPRQCGERHGRSRAFFALVVSGFSLGKQSKNQHHLDHHCFLLMKVVLGGLRHIDYVPLQFSAQSCKEPA